MKNPWVRIRIFFSKAPQEINIKTDFSKLFSDESNSSGKLSLPGVISFKLDGQIWFYDAEVSVRGNTSRYDCSFKKLSLKLDENVKGPLSGVSKLRINTHCSDNKDGYTAMGRVAGSAGPVREGAVYSWMNTLDLSTFRSLVTPITYEDTSGQINVKSLALILDSKKDLGQRLGAKVLEEEDVEDQVAFLDRVSEIGQSNQILRSLLFNVLIGNMDYSLQIKDLKGERHYSQISPPSGLWNMLAFDYGSIINIVPTDFDVAGIVTQKIWASDPITQSISGCDSSICELQFLGIQKWRSFFKASDFAMAFEIFLTKNQN